MKRLFHILLILALVMPTGAAHVSMQNSPENCVMCGHACCCPEVCATKIAAAKKTNHCDQPTVICRIGASAPNSAFMTEKYATDVRPIDSSWIETLYSQNTGDRNLLPFDSSVLTVSPLQDILTPPPRIVFAS